jgi:hypothetical protein
VTLADYARIAKHAGLGRSEALLEAVAGLEGDPVAVADALRAHHLIPLIRAGVPEAVLRARLPEERMRALTSRRPVQRATPERLLATFAEVRDALGEAGVPVLLLKGLYFAQRLYGGIERRPQFDLDLLVPRRDRRPALRTLASLGFAPKARDAHAHTVVRDGLGIDLHHALRRAPAFRLDEAALWSSAVEREVRGVAFRTLSDEYTIVGLVLAAYEDLGQGMAKLKSLLDLYLWLRPLDAACDWEAFLARRAAENLLAVAVNVLDLVVELFEARDELPRLAAALERHRGLRVIRDREGVYALVGAPRKAPASFEWFSRVYPGSVPRYLLGFWAAGLPGNLRDFDLSRLRATLAAALARRARPTLPG